MMESVSFQKTIKKDPKWRPNWRKGWKPGQSGNPAGRPKGVKNKAVIARTALTRGEMLQLHKMSKKQLVALIKRHSAAYWGVFMNEPTTEEYEQALMDRLKVLALCGVKPSQILKAIELYEHR